MLFFFLNIPHWLSEKPVKGFGSVKQRSDVKASILKIYEMEMRKEEHKEWLMVEGWKSE